MRPASGLVGIPDAEISKRARDKSLSSEERQRYLAEEKVRKLRNTQKRQSKIETSSPINWNIPVTDSNWYEHPANPDNWHNEGMPLFLYPTTVPVPTPILVIP